MGSGRQRDTATMPTIRKPITIRLMSVLPIMPDPPPLD